MRFTLFRSWSTFKVNQNDTLQKQRPNQGNTVQPPEPTGLRGTLRRGIKKKESPGGLLTQTCQLQPRNSSLALDSVKLLWTTCWDVGAQCHEHCLEVNLSTTMTKRNKTKEKRNRMSLAAQLSAKLSVRLSKWRLLIVLICAPRKSVDLPTCASFVA
jgi:hypothetical protein